MESTLYLDIGSGTQDALLHVKGERISNCPKFVLPSPARLVGNRIQELTEAKKSIYLCGRNMGGGFFRNIKAHKSAGLSLAAHPEAALALSDDPARLESMGVMVSKKRPEGHVAVHLGDYDAGFWRGLLGQAGLAYPDRVVAAAQDHGFHAEASNRKGRFDLWEAFLTQAKGHMQSLVFDDVPKQLTRLAVLQQDIGGGPVADTGAAAVLGALYEEEIESLSRRQGICVVNLGNSHLIAFLIFKDRVYGVYEHHTGLLDAAKLWEQLGRFRAGNISGQEVFDDQGHGCLTLELPAEAGGFQPTFVIGPQREMLAGFDAVFPAPGGDMMLAGCFGLLKAMQDRNDSV